tara:strand:- start:8 stop:568 length:561 start_codon:yes stop_codon:yes gene_type:complete
MPYKTKEDRDAYQKEYEKTPAGIKASRKSAWKRAGIIFDDVDKFYEKFLSTTHCQICKKQLTVDKNNTHSTRCVDHDHTITDKENVRYICCLSCNCIDKTNNTSGEPNISYAKRDKRWRFQKIVKGKLYGKFGFKTKEEAIHYKYSFLHKLKQVEINKQITSEEEWRKTRKRPMASAQQLGHEYSS